MFLILSICLRRFTFVNIVVRIVTVATELYNRSQDRWLTDAWLNVGWLSVRTPFYRWGGLSPKRLLPNPGNCPALISLCLIFAVYCCVTSLYVIPVIIIIAAASAATAILSVRIKSILVITYLGSYVHCYVPWQTLERLAFYHCVDADYSSFHGIKLQYERLSFCIFFPTAMFIFWTNVTNFQKFEQTLRIMFWQAEPLISVRTASLITAKE